MRVGSKDKARKEYDLVFEDQIDFIMDRVEVGDIEVRGSSATRMLVSPSLPPHIPIDEWPVNLEEAARNTLQVASRCFEASCYG